LFFLLIVPLNALANCQRSYWCINGVNDTTSACIAGVIDTGKVGDIYCPVSMTTVKLSKTVKVSLTGVVDTGKELFTGVNDTSNACIASVVDTGEAPK
jgi:hypothetical protein